MKKICPVTDSEYDDIDGSSIKKCYYHFHNKGDHYHDLNNLSDWFDNNRICLKLRPFIYKKILELRTIRDQRSQ